jgi:hypothetical protein
VVKGYQPYFKAAFLESLLLKQAFNCQDLSANFDIKVLSTTFLDWNIAVLSKRIAKKC